MYRPRNILGLLLVLLAVVLASQYLASLRVKVVTGLAARHKDLKTASEVVLLSWLLPKRSREISYRVMPVHRYYEAIFKIDEDQFEKWIEDIQGGEIEALAPADDQLLEQRSSISLIDIPVPDGIEFHMNIIKSGSIHIADGIWLPQITTSKFRLFSASFDAQQSRAYVYFYR